MEKSRSTTSTKSAKIATKSRKTKEAHDVSSSEYSSNSIDAAIPLNIQSEQDWEEDVASIFSRIEKSPSTISKISRHEIRQFVKNAEKEKLRSIKGLQMKDFSREISAVVIDRKKEFNDDADLLSLQPSYTNFQLPCDVVCRLRYQASKKKYEQQFLHEIKLIQEHQSGAYEAARFNRIFSLATLWPSLHTATEIDYFMNNFLRFTPKQQERLDYLMREPQI